MANYSDEFLTEQLHPEADFSEIDEFAELLSHCDWLLTCEKVYLLGISMSMLTRSSLTADDVPRYQSGIGSGASAMCRSVESWDRSTRIPAVESGKFRQGKSSPRAAGC